MCLSNLRYIKDTSMEKENDKKELPFLMRKWHVVCFLIFLAVSIFIVISGGSSNHPFTGTFFCQKNKNASFAILDPPENFYIKVDNGEKFAVKRYKLDIPYKYELTNDRLIIHTLSPVKDAGKLAKMGSATVVRSNGGRLKYSMSYDVPFTISKSEYVVDGNEVVRHYDYENSSFMTLFPTVFAFVLLYYLGKALINIYKRFKQI